MINVTLQQNEMTITGEVVAGEIYPGLCCAGYDWEVTLVDVDGHREPAWMTVWGHCNNPSCAQGVDQVTDNDYYRGLGNFSIEDIALRLLEKQEATP